MKTMSTKQKLSIRDKKCLKLNTQIEILEFKSTITKISLERLNNKFELAEEIISKPEMRPIEIIKSEEIVRKKECEKITKTSETWRTPSAVP